MSTININRETIEYIYDIYQAKIINHNGLKKLRPFKKNDQFCNKFSYPSTCSYLAKIYIIKNILNEIIYIGKTTQSLSIRFRQGLNPQEDQGYHGYKWKENEEINIHCITIEAFSDSEIESTEAELVYLFRLKYGRWPINQTEIHFSNNEKCKEIAEILFKELVKR
jgi:hypothetical protein